MKKVLLAIYRVLCDTALVFGTIIMFFALFIINSTTANLTGEVILSLFGFAGVFGLSGVLSEFAEIPRVIVTIVRFIVSAVGFVVFVLLPFDRPTEQIFVGTALFVVLYWIVFLIVKLLLIPFGKKEEQDV